ncbi:ribokinase, partial [Myriangium duriaei CBS 260.36]
LPTMTGAVAVIGSLNIDFITNTPRMADAGETLTATSFTTGFGGKGANQAVACARLSGPSNRRKVQTLMVGAVGSDSFGNDYLSALEKEGISTSHIRRVCDQKTGIANIIVEQATGENRILLAPNANHAFSADQDLVPDNAAVVVFQLEIPLSTVVHNARLAREKGKYVLLNPAPAVELPDEIYPAIDCIVLNETEAAIMTQGQDKPWTEFFFAKGVRDLVVLTLGGDGVHFVSREGPRAGQVVKVPARKVKVVDTTAAGDTFVGALATKIAEDPRNVAENVQGFVEFANAAAGRTVQKAGAMDAIPTLEEVQSNL